MMDDFFDSDELQNPHGDDQATPMPSILTSSLAPTTHREGHDKAVTSTADVQAAAELRERNESGNESTPNNTDPSQETDHSENNRSCGSEFRLGWMQFAALVHKHLLYKFRTPIATVFEIFSPVLLLLVLAAAYNLSEIEYRDEATYAAIKVDATPWLQQIVVPMLLNNDNTMNIENLASTLLDSWNANNQSEAINEILEQILSGAGNVPGGLTNSTAWEDLLDEWLTLIDQTSSIGIGGNDRLLESLYAEPSGGNSVLSQATPFTQDVICNGLFSPFTSLFGSFGFCDYDEIDIGSTVNEVEDNWKRQLQRLIRRPASSSNTTNGTRTTSSNANLQAMRRQLNQLLKQPVPIPSLDVYVAISRLLTSMVDVDALPEIVSQSRYGRQWGNLLTLGTLHVVQDQSSDLSLVGLNSSFVDFLNVKYPLAASQLTIRQYATEEEGLRNVQDMLDREQERTWALLDLRGLSTVSPDMSNSVVEKKFKIRMNYTTVPDTNEITDWVAIGLNTDYQRYYLSGYLSLQQAVNEYVYNQSLPKNVVDDVSTSSLCSTILSNSSSVMSMPMPTASYAQNSFFLAVGFLLGLTIVMAYLYPTSRLIKLVVEEKETRLKELLMILGVKPVAYWWSWFIVHLVVFVVIAILVTAMLSATVLKYSSAPYLFIWIGLFSTATMGFSLFVAALFSRAKLASVIGPMALFVTLLPKFIFFGSSRYENATAMKWASILPATAFAFGADIVADYEYSQQGIQSWNAAEGEYSFNTSIAFLFLDTLIYHFLAWYLEQVLPRPYGSPRPFYFVVSPWYWCGLFLPERARRRTLSERPDGGEDPDHAENHEAVIDSTLEPGVVIRNLVKSYGRKKDNPRAVDNLNLTLYESQITALLGHNGAGKTTTVSLLTGLITPTSGDCEIFGKSILHETPLARRSIGVCMQQNTLFDRLTVSEHISLFQRLKGVRASTSSIRQRAEEIGLEEYVHTTSDALSGGNKRKLSVAVALCGDPAFLVLDEPTSGMDPKARRACWEILRRKKPGRVILLTTHFMDEAELLSDRVAVMKEGILQCSGSPMFLKHRFGLGYRLTVVLSSESGTEGDALGRVEEGTVSAFPEEGAKDRLLKFLSDLIPGTEITRFVGREVTFRLPKGSEILFADAFSALEDRRDDLGVNSFGIENASLEEVFILLAESDSVPAGDAHPEGEVAGVDSGDKGSSSPEVTASSQVATPLSNAESTDSEEHVPSESSALDLSHSEYSHLNAARQVSLLYWKRATMQRRDLKGACFLVIVPVILVALVLLILMVDIPFAGPAIELTPNLYDTSVLGGSGNTEAVVGGGSSMAETTSNNSILSKEFLSMQSSMDQIYRKLQFRLLEEERSSEEVSQYLLRTYNDRGYEMRFGSFVIDDLIQVELSLNYSEVVKSLEPVLQQMSNVIQDTESPNPGLANLTQLLEDLLSGSLPGDALPANNSFLNESQSFEFDISSELSLLHNSSSPHAVAAFNQAFSEYIYRRCGGSPAARLVSVQHPLPLTSQQTIEVKTALSIIASLFILIPYCYVPGAFIVFLVKEKTCKSKHLQLVSGVNLSSYWAAHYLFDITVFLLLTVLIMLVFLAYGSDSAEVFVGDAESFFCTMALTFGYGLSILPFSYLIARSFQSHSSAQIAVIGIVFITGFVAVNAYFIMSTIETTKDLAESLRPLFRLWPAYNVGEGLIQMASAFWQREVLDDNARPFDWEVSGISLALVYGLTIPYGIIVMLLEYASDTGSGGPIARSLRWVGRAWVQMMLRFYGVREKDGSILLNDGLDDRDGIEDEDVREEREYVLRNKEHLSETAPVVYRDLWKVFPPSVGFFSSIVASTRRLLETLCCFPCRKQRSGARAAEREDRRKAMLPKRAVRGVTLALSKGEVHALLGKNGAGKSTTIGVLTGDCTATKGSVSVVGHDVTTGNNVSEARKHIGFCPQKDPLLDLMTCRETLRLFARLRGIPKDSVDSHINAMLNRLTLTPHADKKTMELSGGNKRKLSLGIALIGSPTVLLIDEPSTGMDPYAKRNGMWKLISEVSRDRSILLTTHSMNEAEALSTRASVMSDGRLLGLGSVQHLKSKYLDGYMIDFVCHPRSNMEAVLARVLEDLPQAELSEVQGRFMRISVPNLTATVGLGAMFRCLQTLMERCLELDDFQLEHYSVSQCSLEQVFLKLINRSGADDEVSKRGDEGIPTEESVRETPSTAEVTVPGA